MKVEGDYHTDGYALLKGLFPQEIMRAFMFQLKSDIGDRPLGIPKEGPNLLDRPAFEIAGVMYPPMMTMLYGLTPTMSALVGEDLLPTYDYLRFYREGDRCRVHSDRYACEHSLSLTLDYSDGLPWALDVSAEPVEPGPRVADDWGGDPFSAVAMEIGDAVLYKGVTRRHGRTTPNPNGWSAHLFLHWVARDGPYAQYAFDQKGMPPPVNFNFAPVA